VGNWINICLTIATLVALLPSRAAEAQTFFTSEQLFQRGKALVDHNCARCHATEAKGESTHAEAPPFRELLKRYPIDALEEGFIDRIYSNHPDMPVFKVDREQLDAILHYIASIQSD